MEAFPWLTFMQSFLTAVAARVLTVFQFHVRTGSGLPLCPVSVQACGPKFQKGVE